MAPKKEKSVFSCQSCGYQTPKWMGRCTECGQWHTLVEERLAKGTGRAAGGQA
ncbi:MAG: DNA repair protein RadA, partial [Desulfobacterales bacterium]